MSENSGVEKAMDMCKQLFELVVIGQVTGTIQNAVLKHPNATASESERHIEAYPRLQEQIFALGLVILTDFGEVLPQGDNRKRSDMEAAPEGCVDLRGARMWFWQEKLQQAMNSGQVDPSKAIVPEQVVAFMRQQAA